MTLLIDLLEVGLEHIGLSALEWWELRLDQDGLVPQLLRKRELVGGRIETGRDNEGHIVFEAPLRVAIHAEKTREFAWEAYRARGS
jgi:hypothetical protein